MAKPGISLVDFDLVDNIFRGLCNQRAGILKALTDDLYKFFNECDQKDHLCLYGLTNGEWIVAPPIDDLSRQVTIGINHIRDQISLKEWVRIIAIECDSALLRLVEGSSGASLNKSEIQVLSKLNKTSTIYSRVKYKSPLFDDYLPITHSE